MNFKEYLVEVGNSIIKPDLRKRRVHDYGASYYYKIGDVNFLTSIDLNDKDDLIKLDVDFSITQTEKGRYDMTHSGNPLEVIGQVVWCVDDYIKTLPEDSKIFALTFTGKEETMDDYRRRDIYIKFVERYLNKKKIKYKIKTFDNDVEVLFDKDVIVGDFK